MATSRDVLVEENVPFAADLADEDVLHLQRLLGGALQLRGRELVVAHTVGHVVLPSHRVLRIRSRKAPAASVLAWSAYVDPRIGNLRILGDVERSSTEADIAAVLAKLFLSELALAVGANGLAKAYRKVEMDSANVRGRIQFAKLARRAGDASRVPCELWDRRPHTAAMKLLAATLGRINSDPVMRSVDAGVLHALDGAFADVPKAIDQALLRGRVSLARNEHGFEPALALARLVLRDVGLNEGSDQVGLSYLVGLDVLFERAVVRALRENGVHVLAKHPLRHVRVSDDGRERPGLSAMELDAWCPALAPGGVVLDAKYKHGISSANLQQVLAYCAITGARVAALVVPHGQVDDRRAYRFKLAGEADVTIHIIEFDVDGKDVESWRAAASKFVRYVLSSCGPVPTSAVA